ncbi:DNA repair protein RecO [Agaribacter marinus]|nr:DNA repair protein RecO [Agaribacter marinus]
MQKLVASGYVIHRRPYRETSLLVDFFTREYGKITVVAKGARGNTKSDRKSLLQALQYLEFECAGRTNLKNLGRVEQKSNALNPQGKALYCVFYINEILQRALPEGEAIAPLFEKYQASLQSLSDMTETTNQAVEPILREFEFSLLAALGYLPDFGYDCSDGAEIDASAFYHYEVESGFMLCDAKRKLAISGKLLLDLANGRLSKDALNAAKFIVRKTLPLVIGDKALKSRELFKTL